MTSLQYLREEEKLARDVYLTLHDQWGLRAFENISGAEQRHMDRIGDLLDAKGIPDPVSDDTIGVFHNQELAALYEELVARGRQSELEALQVGATIEDMDLKDIADMKEQTRDPELLSALDMLECGSRNHMRAFTRQLRSRGADYAPQHISAAQYEEIIAGEHERCGRGGRGMGDGGMGGGGGGMGRGGMGHGGMGGCGMHGGGMGGMQGGGCMSDAQDGAPEESF